MSAAAMLSIKPRYANKILAGSKTIELRKSSMGLNPGDVILVYSSAPEQRVTFWFPIQAIETLSIGEMWDRYQSSLGIEQEDYGEYFKGLSYAVGLHVGQIHTLTPIPLQQLEHLIPGFVPPQGLIWLRDDLGKFEGLLAALSCPLPDRVFAQQNLMF